VKVPDDLDQPFAVATSDFQPFRDLCDTGAAAALAARQVSDKQCAVLLGHHRPPAVRSDCEPIKPAGRDNSAHFS
jgi:hypothetical protein